MGPHHQLSDYELHDFTAPHSSRQGVRRHHKAQLAFQVEGLTTAKPCLSLPCCSYHMPVLPVLAAAFFLLLLLTPIAQPSCGSSASDSSSSISYGHQINIGTAKRRATHIVMRVSASAASPQSCQGLASGGPAHSHDPAGMLVACWQHAGSMLVAIVGSATAAQAFVSASCFWICCNCSDSSC